MKEKTSLHHVALQYSDRKKAEIFFNKILKLPLQKTFTINKDLSNSIFGIEEEAIIDVYSNDDCYFEIFITKKTTKYNYEHISIEISNKDEFVNRCKKYVVQTNFIKKGEKTLLFIKDFAGNLFEIKEKML